MTQNVHIGSNLINYMIGNQIRSARHLCWQFRSLHVHVMLTILTIFWIFNRKEEHSRFVYMIMQILFKTLISIFVEMFPTQNMLRDLTDLIRETPGRIQT